MINLNNHAITNIFNEYVSVNNVPEYINRYNDFSFETNHRAWRWEGKDFPRVISVLEFERLKNKHNIHSNHLLSFNSYSDPEVEILQPRKITNFNYTDDPDNYDLHTLKIPEDDYDFVMLNQTFEHLYNPHICIDNISNYIKSGTYFYANVPTVNIQHSLPNNYYTGLTPIGLACLFVSCEYDIIEIGQWGNSDYINKIFTTHEWPDYNNVLHKNEFDNPVQCWIIARKK